ncbi:MAG TPA: hypothetical protein VKE22_14955 [Haliangiales bacterium]|nr:hypothetical protein [Haliangiales bacterium]
MRAHAPAACALLLAGCLDAIGPDVGAPTAARCLDEDSDLGTDVSFARDVQPLLMQRCTLCHAPGRLGFEIIGLDLTSYAALRAGGRVGGSAIVLPGEPCESIIVQKIGEGPPFGARMPLNGPPFLTDAQRALIHDWIAEGAREN